jgi:hypothetical protein
MRFLELVKSAWQVSVSKPALWLAAAIQIAAVFALSVKLESLYVQHTGPFGGILVLSLLLFSAASVWLWKKNQQAYFITVKKEEVQIKWSNISFARLSLLSLLVFFILFGSRLAEVGWLTSIVIGALILPTSLACALALVLLDWNFFRAGKLAADFWALRSTVPAFAALIFMVLHGWAFALARNTYQVLGIWQGFSESVGFGTIWSLALWLAWGLGILGSFLNTFLVFGFLEILKTTDSGLKKEALAAKPIPAVQ